MKSRLQQTTLRFDADSWSRIGAEAERVGLSRAAFIRDAARAETLRAENRRELLELTARIERIEGGLRRVVDALVRARR